MNELTGRVNELNCLYRITKIEEEQNKSLYVVLKKIVKIIQEDMQLPDIACAEINYKGKILKTDNYRVINP